LGLRWVVAMDIVLALGMEQE
jgi:hypothetical protein